MNRTSIIALITIAGATVASADVVIGSGGPLSIDGEDTERINIDVTSLTGSYISWVFTADFGGDRPNDNEFDLDIRTLFRTDTSLPFSLFLEDSNFDFEYDSNNILTVREDFSTNSNFAADALNGGDYERVRLDLFNDDTSRLTIESWSLTLIAVPSPAALSSLALAGLVAARRRR